MNYSHRFFLYGPVGLFAILMACVMGYWWIASSAFSHRLDAINGHEVAPGIRVGFAKKTIGGFPFRLDSELDGLRVEIATSHGPTVWTAEHFALHSLTYGREQFILEAAGKQLVSWHDDAGAPHRYAFLPGTLRASSISDGQGLSRFDLDLVDDDSDDVSASRLQLHLRRDPKLDAFDVFVSADGVHIARALKPAFGPDLKSLSIDALVSPGSSFERLLSGRSDWRPAVEDWHARDGGLLIKNATMRWGALDIAGQGALAVDDAHRPLGALQLSISNWQKLVQEAQRKGWLAGANSGLAAGFFAFAGDPKGDAPLSATLTFKDGVVYVGPIPADLLSPLY